MKRRRLNVYLEPDHARRLDQVARARGLSKSFVVAAALDSALSPDAADRREAATLRRLDQLGRQFEKLERDQNILIETVAIFVRYYLSAAPAVPEAHQDAVKAKGRARFQQFVQQLARHLQRGNSLVREVYEEVVPEESRFSGHAEQSPAETAESAA